MKGPTPTPIALEDIKLLSGSSRDRDPAGVGAGAGAGPGAELPKLEDGFSVLTYNILLPNSVDGDGWWCYKMYSPGLVPILLGLGKEEGKEDEGKGGDQGKEKEESIRVEAEGERERGVRELVRASSWASRSRLLEGQLRTANADVVCLQEVSPDSFESDFSFMAQLGYGGREMHNKKGRFRPATFWKTTVLRKVESSHRDRCLVTLFQLNPGGRERERREANGDVDVYESEKEKEKKSGDSENPSSPLSSVYVINCHLQAGPNGPRRLRQIHDALEYSFKAARRARHPKPDRFPLVVCGDFNGDEASAAISLLENGEVGPCFIEDGEPVTSKVKKNPLGNMKDASAQANRVRYKQQQQQQHSNSNSNSNNNNSPKGKCENSGGKGSPPSTLVVQELISVLTQDGYEGRETKISDRVKEQLRMIFDDICTEKEGNSVVSDDTGRRLMSRSGVESWLIRINGHLGRGSEFRAAVQEMISSTSGPLQQQSGSLSAGVGEKVTAPALEENNGDIEGDDAPSAAAVLPLEGTLNLEAFWRIYEAELKAGKYWGVAFDLYACGHPLPEITSPQCLFRARYDRIYISSGLTVNAILDYSSELPCPNHLHPSDHLPVGAALKFLANTT